MFSRAHTGDAGDPKESSWTGLGLCMKHSEGRGVVIGQCEFTWLAYRQ